MINMLETELGQDANDGTDKAEAVKNRLDQLCEAVFKKIYLDSSGKITLEELKTATVTLGLKLTEDEIHEMLVTADHDDDKTIDLEEFKHLMEHELEVYHKKVDQPKCCTIL